MSDTATTTTTEKATQAILYKFLTLHDRMMEERVELAKQTAQLTKTMEDFAAHIAHFETIDARVQKSLSTHIQVAAKQVGTSLGEEASNAAIRNVEHALNDFRRGVEQNTHFLETARQEAQFSMVRTVGIAIAAGLLTGLLSIWLLIPKPTLPFTPEQFAVYEIGITMNKAWPKMTKAEKEKMYKLASD
jgi:hypothetical protein